MGWCVAQLDSGRQSAALAGLRELADAALIADLFNPLADGKPLLSGYAFADFDASDGDVVARVRRVRGVTALLPVGHEFPTELRAGVIERLKSDLAAGDYDDVRALPAHRFKKGEMMRIVSGPYSVFGQARFLQTDHGMVVAEVELLGRAAKVRLKGHQIEPV